MHEPTTPARRATAAWLALLRTQQAMERVTRRSMDDVGLGFSDFVLLEALLHVGPLTPSQLGEKIGITRGSITAAVDRLCARGLVGRGPNASDARSSLVKLTTAGTALIEPAWEAHATNIARVIGAALTPEELVVLLKLLRPIRREARQEIERARPGALPNE